MGSRGAQLTDHRRRTPPSKPAPTLDAVQPFCKADHVRECDQFRALTVSWSTASVLQLGIVIVWG